MDPIKTVQHRSDSATNTNTSEVSLQTFPQELTLLVFSHLAIEDLAQSRSVCRLWKILSDDVKLLRQVFRRTLLQEVDYKKINNLILYILNHKNKCDLVFEHLVIRSEYFRISKIDNRKWRPLDACISALAYIFFNQYCCRRKGYYLYAFGNLELYQKWKLAYSFEIKSIAKDKNKSPYAQFVMGLSYAIDSGYKRAKSYLKKSHLGGYSTAAYILGCLPNNQGRISIQRQLDCFKKAFEGGCLEAGKSLSILFSSSSLKGLKAVAEQNAAWNIQKDLECAQFFLKQGEEEGLLYLIPHAREKNREIQFTLGVLFENDIRMEDPWLLFAEKQGEKLVPFFIGRLFAKIETLDLEAKNEVLLYESALFTDKYHLHKILAKMYTTGHVLTISPLKAEKHKAKAAEIVRNIKFNYEILTLEKEIEGKIGLEIYKYSKAN